MKTTKVKVKTTSKGRSNRVKSDNITLSSVSLSAPTGTGVTAGGAAPASVLPAVGAGAPAKVRQTGADQLQAAIIREDDIKLAGLRSRIASHFALPEWSGAAALRASLLPLVESGVMSSEQYDAVLAAAARKAGVVAPCCSVARVLAVVRAHYIKEFESVCGCTFESVRTYYKENGCVAGVFSLLLPLGSVRANSLQSDYVSCASLAAGASASAVVSAVLSFRFLAAFRFAVSAAVSAAKVNVRNNLANCWRDASRLGMSFDDVRMMLEEIAYYVSETDNKQRNQLRKNNEHAWRNINEINDLILLAGGADFAGCENDKQRAKVCKLLAKRARYESVVSTTSRLLEC